MNAIQKALMDVKYRIPREVLDTAFVDTYNRFQNVSIDERIRNEIIRTRVLPDCNIYGGVMMKINLSQCQKLDSDLYTSVWYVPKELTDGKSIISVLDVVSNTPPSTPGPDVISMANRVDESINTPHGMHSARVELIAENTVVIRRFMPVGSFIYLSVRVGNDENLSNIDPRSYPVFSELVTYATQSYIYNKLIVSMNISQTYAGHDSSRLYNIIEGYQDSEELYQTTLREKWMKVAFCNDVESHANFIKSMVSPGL